MSANDLIFHHFPPYYENFLLEIHQILLYSWGFWTETLRRGHWVEQKIISAFFLIFSSKFQTSKLIDSIID
jgi:hypothetical protein